jgi:hypothetical protein
VITKLSNVILNVCVHLTASMFGRLGSVKTVCTGLTTLRHAAEFRWRHSDELFEGARKMTLVVKTQGSCDLNERRPGLGQLAAGVLDADLRT